MEGQRLGAYDPGILDKPSVIFTGANWPELKNCTLSTQISSTPEKAMKPSPPGFRKKSNQAAARDNMERKILFRRFVTLTGLANSP